MKSETHLKQELKSIAYRHSKKLLDKINPVIRLPDIVCESIQREIEYATLDGYRETMKYIRNGAYDDIGNR